MHAQLDHPSRQVVVPLEQVGQGPAIPGSDPLEQVDGFTRWVVHALAKAMWLALRLWLEPRELAILPQCRL